jgi:3-phosphoinositide dependent protein kinase-1
MEEPQASPIIKRNATSTTCLANPPEENKEETKEAQQPASAMIQSTSKARLTMDDFQKITSLGRGSYGEVFLVKKIANGKLYALKSIDKNFMKKEKKEHQVYVEREVLMKLNHPNIIKLVSSFQDKNKLYFVLEYVSGGEFSDYLRVQGKLTKEQVIFFSAEIINILEYLHTFGIAHRDMKPENLLLTQEGHIKCIDFGTARFLANDKRTADLYNIKKGEDTLEMAASAQKKNHRSTFVGTAQYVSPEMLEGSDCGAPADLWALGCMIYLMTVGQFPFIDMNEYLIFQKIKAASVKYPEDMDSEIKDIIQKLLVKGPNDRLGAGEKESGNGYDALKGHPLFKNIDFSTLNEQKPPVIEIASPHKKKSQDIQSTGNSNVGIGMQNNRKVNSEDLTKPSPAKTGQAFNFQMENQVKPIISGLVLKKCGWLFYKPRQLILNNKPRLVYYDPDSNQLKGEIPLAPTTKAELESKTKFIVTCPNKKFVFKEMEHSAEKWVEIINKTVEQLYAKKPDQ